MNDKVHIDNQKLEDLLSQVFHEDAEKEQKLKTINSTVSKIRKRQVLQKTFIFGTPIAVAAILVLWLIVIPHFQSFDPDRFYKQHFQSELGKNLYRGYEPNNNLNNNSTFGVNLDQQIKLGVQAMVSENWKQAESIFNQLIPVGGSAKIQSLWYLILIQLKTDQIEQCKYYLQMLIKTKDHTYLKPAKKLLRSINATSSR
ncbi:MAG: hypothetical protein J7L96_11095 [Bacteroidales bacterium]|nr:hypothetical protein [Bacteroidales bacterium]